MTVSIYGILSHRKLMELKNSGIVEPEIFDSKANEKYKGYMIQVADNLQFMNAGIWKYLGGYTRKKAEMEARLMFSDRRELLEHMIVLSGSSKFLQMTPNELTELTVLHQAALGAERAKRVLLSFRYSDEVFVDEETGFHVDWLLKNATTLRSILAEKGENYE